MQSRSYKEHIIATTQEPYTTLDFGSYRGFISTAGQLINDSDFTFLLGRYPNATTVNFSGHWEISGLFFSLMRKNLANLQTLILRNIKADEFNIPTDQLAKMYAKGVKIEADPPVMQKIKSQLVQLLRDADKNEYADQLQASNDINQQIQPNQLLEATRIVEEREEAKAREEFESFQREQALYNSHNTLYVFTKKLMLNQDNLMKVTVYADSEETAKQYLEAALSKNKQERSTPSMSPAEEKNLDFFTNTEGFSCKALQGGDVYNEYHGRRGGKDDVFVISEIGESSYKKKDLGGPRNNAQISQSTRGPSSRG